MIFNLLSGRGRHALPAAALAVALALPWATQAAVTLPAAAPETPAAAPAQGGGAAPSAPGAVSTPAFDDRPIEGRAVGELARRKAALDKREQDLEQREARIAAAEALARREIATLTALRIDVEKLVSRESAGAEQDLALLAALYANMKPNQAAMILGKLDIPKAAAILRRLDTRLAGPVLASMDPGMAAGITQELERHRAPFRQ